MIRGFRRVARFVFYLVRGTTPVIPIDNRTHLAYYVTVEDEHIDALAEAITQANAAAERRNGYYYDPTTPPTSAADMRRIARGPTPTLMLRPQVCHTAWSGLIAAATQARYVNANATKTKGMSKFIIDTIMHPMQSWTDTRPPTIAALDAERAGHYLPPVWITSDRDCWSGRLQRQIIARALDTTVLATLATDFQLSDNWHLESAAVKSHSIQLGLLLEVWGHSYLMPNATPTTPPRHTGHRTPRRELVW